MTAHRVAAPGEPLPPEALVSAGWPKERMAPEAAMSRLRTALSGLRRLGLRELLKRHPRGYLLDPCVPTAFATGRVEG